MRATCPAHTGLDFFTLILFDEDQFVAVIFLHLLGLYKVSLLLFPPHKSVRSPSSCYWLQELKYGEFSGRRRREFVVGPTWQGEHPTLLMELLVEICSCYFWRLAACYCVKYVCMYVYMYCYYSSTQYSFTSQYDSIPTWSRWLQLHSVKKTCIKQKLQLCHQYFKHYSREICKKLSILPFASEFPPWDSHILWTRYIFKLLQRQWHRHKP